MPFGIAKKLLLHRTILYKYEIKFKNIFSLIHLNEEKSLRMLSEKLVYKQQRQVKGPTCYLC